MKRLWYYILRLFQYDFEGNQALDDEDETYIMRYIKPGEPLQGYRDLEEKTNDGTEK